jgi:hypothetical protein
MEFVTNLWNVNAYQAGPEFYVRHQFVQKVVTKKEDIVDVLVNVAVALDGMVTIVLNVSHILVVKMENVTDHGNVIVIPVGVVCYVMRS